MPAADRRRHRRCRVRRVRPFLPGEGVVPGRGRGAADPRPDHRRCRGGVRRDDAAVRAGREKKYVHGAFTEGTPPSGSGPAAWTPCRRGSCRAGQDVVSDQVRGCSFRPGWSTSPGTSRRVYSHLLRDYEDCAETYPGAVWPVQARRALRGSSMPGTPPASRAWTPSPPMPGNRWSADSGGPSWPAWLACPASPARRTARNGSPHVGCSAYLRQAFRAASRSCSPRTPASGQRTTSARKRSPAPENPAENMRPPGRRRRHPGPLTYQHFLESARERGKNAMDVLHDLMLGRPWRPPAQAFSP